MNGGNTIMFTKGIQMTNDNGQINKKEYQAMYDGNKGKMVLNDNDDIYYIEADENDIEGLFNKPKSNEDLNIKIKNLVKKKNKRKRIKIKTPSRKRKKIHYTVRKRDKKKTPSKKKTKTKPRTKSRKKTRTKPRKKTRTKPRKKTPSKKKTTQRLLPQDLLKTIL